MLSRSYEIFMAVCITKSFTKAARRLRISQSAISQSIQGLEKSLGFSLFQRNSRPLKLTEEAHVLFNELSFEKDNFNRTLNTLKTQNFIRPVMRLGMVESMAAHMSPILVGRMLKKCSKVILYSGVTNDLVQKLLLGEIDYAVISGFSLEEPVQWLNIYSEPQVLVLPKELLRRRSSWDLSALQVCGIPFVRYTQNTDSNKTSRDVLSSYEGAMPETMQVDSNRIAFSLVESGMAWTIAQPVSLAAEGEDIFDRVTVLPLQGEAQGRRFMHVVGRRGNPSFWLDMIRDICQDYVEEKLVPVFSRRIPWVVPEILVNRESNDR